MKKILAIIAVVSAVGIAQTASAKMGIGATPTTRGEVSTGTTRGAPGRLVTPPDGTEVDPRPGELGGDGYNVSDSPTTDKSSEEPPIQGGEMRGTFNSGQTAEMMRAACHQTAQIALSQCRIIRYGEYVACLQKKSDPRMGGSSNEFRNCEAVRHDGISQCEADFQDAVAECGGE